MRLRVLAVVVFVLAWSTSLSAYALTITLNGDGSTWLSNWASDGSGSGTTVEDFPASLPYDETLVAAQGGSSSTTTYALSDDAFEFAFNQVRTSTRYAGDETYNDVYFSPSEDVDYALSGEFSSVDPDGRYIRLAVVLRDLSNRFYYTPIFISDQVSGSTINENLVLGQMGGDQGNSLTGSLNGTLIAGREYLLHVHARTDTIWTAGTADAQATGFVRFAFVPEASNALLVGLALSILAGARRLRE